MLKIPPYGGGVKNPDAFINSVYFLVLLSVLFGNSKKILDSLEGVGKGSEASRESGLPNLELGQPLKAAPMPPTL